MQSNILIESTVDGIKEASELLSLGKLVAFPTETVYGLGANALNEVAVLSIFEAKGRPLTDPLIVHVTNKENAKLLLDLDNNMNSNDEMIVFDALADHFWPGPLTIIALASSRIPKLVTAGTGYVGVRVPSHPLALALLEECKLPIAAPSANRFGHVSPTRAQHVIDDLGDKGVRVLNGDEKLHEKATCNLGIESTVARISGVDKHVHIFRQGGITKQQIDKVISSLGLGWKVDVISRVVNMKHTNDTIESIDTIVGQEAPGQAITHYAPDIPTYIISSYEINNHDNIDTNKKIITSKDLASIVIIDFGGKMISLERHCLAYKDLSSSSSANEGANKLFETLRWAETCSGARQVFLPKINQDNSNNDDNDDLSDGLADRILRAGSGVFIDIALTLQ